MKWYADDSETRTEPTNIPDVYMFGGVAIRDSDIAPLRQAIERIKEPYGSNRAPVKWNFKDLSKVYAQHEWQEIYDKMLADSNTWRKLIIDTACRFDICVIVSIVESHSIKREIIKDKKFDLSSYAFCDCLQRLSMYTTQDTNHNEQVDIVLDMPACNNPGPYNTEYTHAYNSGKTANSHDYFSGPLKNHNYNIAVRLSDKLQLPRMQ